ncbi:MAG: hypothetical protein CFH01_00043 [Alphaproteobacteria bacterium MarineAlpha2_Bin1]|nr:MAG: hypothetical protein CFH01_00043 [Alphaproteobacteria bacterium MarineAlpha2_Bin1]|tara:strand:- start:959 stop:1597 length:639 start_codon:yes stop_codon:yes gene_type:complete
MIENIDLFWSMRSSYSYLALDRIIEIREKYNVKINIKFVLPLALRYTNYFTNLPKNRKNYGILDNLRIAEYYNIPFEWPNPDPVKFTNGIPDDNQPIAYKISRMGVLAEKNEKGFDYIDALSRSIWDGKNKNWNDPDSLNALFKNIGLNYQEMEDEVNKNPSDYDEILESNAVKLESSGHWGVPTLVLRNEPFFGQDRIQIFEWKLKKILEI